MRKLQWRRFPTCAGQVGNLPHCGHDVKLRFMLGMFQRGRRHHVSHALAVWRNPYVPKRTQAHEVVDSYFGGVAGDGNAEKNKRQ